MDSRELGLVLVQQLTGIDDLHYGFWKEDQKATLLEFVEAQKRYTELTLSAIAAATNGIPQAHILDVGCGTGTLMVELLARDYHVDGVIPSAYLKSQIEKRLTNTETAYHPTLFECKFEDLLERQLPTQYDLALFSESFQYIPLNACLETLNAILKPGGKVVINDFFKTEHHGDRGTGDRSFGGGHQIEEFYRAVTESGFTIVNERDITRNVSPNIELLDDILSNRLGPSLGIINDYIYERYPLILRLFRFVTRKKLAKVKYKYFSGLRNKQNFEKYKTYRLITLARKHS